MTDRHGRRTIRLEPRDGKATAWPIPGKLPVLILDGAAIRLIARSSNRRLSAESHAGSHSRELSPRVEGRLRLGAPVQQEAERQATLPGTRTGALHGTVRSGGPKADFHSVFHWKRNRDVSLDRVAHILEIAAQGGELDVVCHDQCPH
jgi:hypothetical protein